MVAANCFFLQMNKKKQCLLLEMKEESVFIYLIYLLYI